MALPWIAAAWKTQLQTGFPSADRFYIDFRGFDYPAIYNSLTYTAITSGTQWCGYSNATGGYAQYMLDMPTKFVLDIRATANFAFDVAADQVLAGWYYDANNRCVVYYRAADDKIVVVWVQGGTASELASAALDAAGLAAVNRITAVVDSTTGSTAGSALYLNGVASDTAWDAAITARSVRIVSFGLRAYGAVGAGLTAGLWNINTVRLFSGVTATAAQVLANFSTVYTEEILWYLNSCPLGHTRVNVTRFVTSRFCERLVSDPDTGSIKANRLTLDLLSRVGEFADDQYAAWDPVNAVYNGLSTQAYMRKRCRVIAETWYGDNFEPYFIGRVEDGFQRSTPIGDVSRVSITAVDQTSELGMRRVRRGRYYEDLWLTSATEANSLLHLFVRLGTQREVYNYVGNSGFENATIANSWTASGGTLSRQADPLVGSWCGQLANASGAEQTVTQIVTYTGTKKLNVGEIWTFSIWLKSAAAAANDITLQERDAGGTHGTTTTAYSLAGGEGWVRYDATRTITDSTSDRLAVVVEVANGVTLKMECAGLIQAARAVEWFADNTTDGTAGTISADSAGLGTYDSHGFAVDVVTIQHGWARVEAGDTPWDHIKQLAEACLAYKCGFSEAGVFTFRAILGDTFADPASAATLTAPMDMVTVLNRERANKIVVRGIHITTETQSRLIWVGSQCGAFERMDDGRIYEGVANGATWPSATLFGAFMARYDFAPGQMGTANYAGSGGPGTARTSPGVGASRVRQLPEGSAIIGCKSPTLIQAIDGGVANQLTVTTLDTSTYADGAIILLTNNTGSGQWIRDIGLLGIPVIRNSGQSGFVHDAFIDWDRIALEGERALEIANGYIVTKAQVEKIADWQWKYSAGIKHQYRITQSGAWFHLEPGDTVTLTVGGAGQKENINSTCRVVSVQTEGTAASFGSSTIVLDEIMEGWTYNSTALARYIASPSYRSNFQGTEVVVASSGYVGQADYFCDGTADQTELNAAILAVSTRTLGGVVRCVGEKFYIAAAVEMKSGVCLDLGGCTFERNCDDYCIEAVGTSGTYLTNVSIIGPGTITKNVADTNTKEFLYGIYVDLMTVSHIEFLNMPFSAIYLESCPSANIDHNNFHNTYGQPHDVVGMEIADSKGILVGSNSIFAFLGGTIAYGILLTACDDAHIIDNQIDDIRSSIDHVLPYYAIGIYVYSGSLNRLISNRISNVSDEGPTPTGGSAIVVTNLSTGTVLDSNICFDNGNLLRLGNCESATPPAIAPEVATINTSCTFARSTDFAHYGTYSYKMSKTAAPGTAARVDLADSTAANDLHGVTVGLSHTHMGYVYIPSVNGPLASEVSIMLQDSTAGAWSSTEIFASTAYYDTWQAVEVTRTIGTTCSAGGFLPSLTIAAAASSSEYVYWDDLRLRPDGGHNEYAQNFADAGTGTKTDGNSWNRPFQG